MVLRMRHILPRRGEEVPCAVALPCWILLHTVCVQRNFVSEALPGGQRLPQGIVPSIAVPLRLQVPGEDDGGDHMPAALLLPEAEQHDTDPLPDRVQVRLAGHVRADRMRAGHVCVLRGQEVVRPVPQGALLRHAHVVGAVPGGVLLPCCVVSADSVPSEQVVSCGIVESAVMMLSFAQITTASNQAIGGCHYLTNTA